jgi:NAD-dependent dihydropyrimidine dehydrogenase PreA subunit
MGLTAPPQVTSRCTGCGACLLTCPERAIRPYSGWARAGVAPLYVLSDACTACGDCFEVCPADALEET